MTEMNRRSVIPTAKGLMPEVNPGGPGHRISTKAPDLKPTWMNDREYATDTKPDWQRDLADVAPYVSNFANAFRRAPEPAVPKTFNPVRFQKVNFAADMAEADRTVAGLNQGLNGLSENAATAARTANLVQGQRVKNQISQEEANQNAQISNREALVNNQVDMQNVNNQNQYQDMRVNKKMVDTTMQSANLANAADKFVASSNQRDLMQLEGTKFDILSKVYRDSGVLDRLTDDMDRDKRTNTPMYKKSAGGMYKVFAHGGLIDEPKPVGPSNVYSRATNKYSNSAGHAYSQSLEADRARDALVLSPQGTQMAATQLNIAPQQAQTSEALRSGDYFAPPAANFQHVTMRQRPVAAPRPVDTYLANVKRFKTGGRLLKVY
jgi:hypothetical protein